ncbi:MAG: heavy-metal-associated domain-containing protein, partial [Deltaproteobacteria bacterium]|nr:heavy-metal-associated domain-containing protein [Deltaproteobacteria bacterium]
MTMNERTRRVVRTLMVAGSVASLAGAGLSGLWFAEHPMDLVLIQLVFYGAWACLLGGFLGGTLGAALEEDACGELDMGTMASTGAILGTLSAGLIGTALTGLALLVPWQAVWLGAVGIEIVHLLGRWFWPFHLIRRQHIDARGCVCDAQGRRLPEDRQPLRMRDRVAVLIAVGAATMIGLTLIMARMMGSDLGHPVMMAPMMYGMFGTMLGGMVGGWLAGLLDEHTGAAEHDNPVMVGAMALMAGMMGGMPSGMIGGMMAIMGPNAIAITVAAGMALQILLWAMAIRGRYRWERAAPAPHVRSAVGGAVGGGAMVRVEGMSCAACVDKVERGLGALPGVSTVQVDLPDGTVHLKWGAAFPGLEAVRETVERLGYG